MEKKILVYDLDETLCTKKRSDESYADVKPIKSMIDQLNKFYDEGHTIIIQTARNMVTQNNDVGKVLQNVGEVTLKWLRENGVKYHSIQFGKPYANYYIDDKSIRPYEILSINNLDDLDLILKNNSLKSNMEKINSIIDKMDKIYIDDIDEQILLKNYLNEIKETIRIMEEK